MAGKLLYFSFNSSPVGAFKTRLCCPSALLATVALQWANVRAASVLPSFDARAARMSTDFVASWLLHGTKYFHRLASSSASFAASVVACGVLPCSLSGAMSPHELGGPLPVLSKSLWASTALELRLRIITTAASSSDGAKPPVPDQSAWLVNGEHAGNRVWHDQNWLYNKSLIRP